MRVVAEKEERLDNTNPLFICQNFPFLLSFIGSLESAVGATIRRKYSSEETVFENALSDERLWFPPEAEERGVQR